MDLFSKAELQRLIDIFKYSEHFRNPSLKKELISRFEANEGYEKND